jgi:hypothetical protein
MGETRGMHQASKIFGGAMLALAVAYLSLPGAEQADTWQRQVLLWAALLASAACAVTGTLSLRNHLRDRQRSLVILSDEWGCTYWLDSHQVVVGVPVSIETHGSMLFGFCSLQFRFGGNVGQQVFYAGLDNLLPSMSTPFRHSAQFRWPDVGLSATPDGATIAVEVWLRDGIKRSRVMRVSVTVNEG